MREYRIIQRGDGRYMAQTRRFFCWRDLGTSCSYGWSPDTFNTEEEARQLIERYRASLLPYKVVLEFEV